MIEILSLFSVGIALSMDTFSLSLSIGTLSGHSKKILQISLIVGIMHFIMPLLGLLFGNQILKIIFKNPNYLMSFILFFIALLMLKDLFASKEETIDLRLLGIFLFALSVSFDSFTTGIGLKALTDNYITASLIFAGCSFTFTFLGLTIGKYSEQKLGKLATILGITLLFIIGIVHLFY